MAMMTDQGRKNYIASQQMRYKNEFAKGDKADKGLLGRLTSDLKRYNALPPVKPAPSVTSPGNNKINYDELYRNQSTDTQNRILGRTTELPPTSTNALMQSQQEKKAAEQPVYEKPPSEFSYDPTKDSRYASYFKTPDPFTYDPKSDPLYQTMLANALTNAGANAKIAQQNAMESLNERGILNSDITNSQVAKIQQDALTGAQSQLESTLLPQLMSQAYQRYNDGLANTRYQADLLRGLTNDEYGRMTGNKQLSMSEAGLTGMYNGQKTLDQKKFDQTQDQLDYEKQRNAAQDTEEKKRWWSEYNRAGEQWAKQNNLNWAELDQRKKEQIADEAWKEKNYQLDKDAAAWTKDPKNPMNMQREANAEAKGKTDKNEYIATQTAEFISKIRNEDLDYDSAVQQINDYIISGVYTKEEGNRILSALKTAGLAPQEKQEKNKIVLGRPDSMGGLFR